MPSPRFPVRGPLIVLHVPKALGQFQQEAQRGGAVARGTSEYPCLASAPHSGGVSLRIPEETVSSALSS